MQEPTLDKLHQMRLGAMATAWQEQQTQPSLQQMSFDERFSLLVDAEHLTRASRRLERRLKEANLRVDDACIEDVHVSEARGIAPAMLAQLASCRWLEEHHNILITGMTGVGKSYLACALGQRACRKGWRVKHQRLSRLLDELGLAKHDGSYAKLLKRIERIDVLIIDDFGLGDINQRQCQDLLEVIEDRDRRHSTIITAQLPIAKWHEWLGEPTLADALLDRLVNRAYKIELKGASKRTQ